MVKDLRSLGKDHFPWSFIAYLFNIINPKVSFNQSFHPSIFFFLYDLKISTIQSICITDEKVTNKPNAVPVPEFSRSLSSRNT